MKDLFRFVLISTFVLCSCKRTHLDTPLFQHPERFEALDEVIQYEKDVIPLLIDKIADTTVTNVGLLDPLSSYIDPLYYSVCKNNCRGIYYAHLIDYYLSYTSEIDSIYKQLSKLPEFTEKRRFFYHRPYDLSVIVRLDDDEHVIPRPLSAEEMLAVQQQYLEWWEKCRQLPLEQLKDYFAKEGILYFPFKWI